jgi:hypothetical protein
MKPEFEFPSKTSVDEKDSDSNDAQAENKEDRAEIKTETENTQPSS